MKTSEGDAETYRVAVRELCEFAAKRGDLDHRFTPSPSANQGILGHKIVAARRAPGRRNEVAVSGQFKELLVRGRVDGFYPAELLLEEVKTFRGDLSRMPANHRALHWAQAKTYGALLCAEQGLPGLNVSLVYFEISSQEETTLVEECSAADLRSFFETLCDTFLAWGIQEISHRRSRNEALASLRFPHDTYRPGQRRLAENVFMSVRRGGCLMAQAPTGIGKKIATIFPLLKACASEGLDKIFFLSAKGSGQRLARKATDALSDAHPGLPLRVIELVSRDKSCEQPGKACHGESCPLASGFYDRLPVARSEAIRPSVDLSRETIRRVAREHRLCPYYLTQELVRWADVVIADYNYVFDSAASLHQLTLANEWQVVLLVDEAHNLVERARSMYSAQLDESELLRLSCSAPICLKRPLDQLAAAWASISEDQVASYIVMDEVPGRFVAGLANLTAAVSELLAETPEDVEPSMLRFFFDALHFQRLAEAFGNHSLFDSTLATDAEHVGAPTSALCIRNVVPAPFLRPRYAAARDGDVFRDAFAAALLCRHARPVQERRVAGHRRTV